jgi:hypothetical protein
VYRKELHNVVDVLESSVELILGKTLVLSGSDARHDGVGSELAIDELDSSDSY